MNCDLTDWCYKNWVATSRKTASETLIMMHRKFRLEVTNILNITRYAIKNECLIPWVKFFWHIEAVNADIHYKLLPTDCIDVILNLADVIVYETEFNRIIAPPFHINGLRSKCSFIHQENNIRIFGITFYPHGLYPFVLKSLKEVQNKVVDLNGFSYSLTQKLKNAVNNDTAEKIIAEIENTLIDELSIKQDFVDKAQLISDFITINDDISVKSFCDERSINIKTFERLFLYYTGYTPKILRRIKRFQNTCNQLVHQHMASLTDITYDNNFTDQSYFIKEFTHFSGTAPRTFQTEKATVKENVKYKYL
ncbi:MULTISPECIES: helix-turn-helix domain-containing protein [Bacillota]|nr:MULTISPECIES: AraC family transcriptional regulator [Bacillota]MDL4907139.1 AraC family transcriptional regulator [Enterococcus gallinarum]